MIFDRPLDQTCLFFDVDGSLIDIAPRPEAVEVPATLIADLDRAAAAVDGALALVSGRSIAQLDALFGAGRFRASGVHGAEMRYEPDGPVIVSDRDRIPPAVWEDLSQVLTGYPGTHAENKRFSFAVHFRAAPQFEEALRRELVNLIERHDADLRLMPGHMVFELKPQTFNKGVAIRRFMGQPRFAGRKPVFLGDDVTDYPGFEAVREFDGLALAVGRPIPGTIGSFSSPAEVRAWVATIAAIEQAHA